MIPKLCFSKSYVYKLATLVQVTGHLTRFQFQGKNYMFHIDVPNVVNFKQSKLLFGVQEIPHFKP